MSYDESKDKLIKFFELKKEKSSFLISVFSYDNGQPKLSFTRSFDKKDGSTGYGQGGRISIDEVKFLKENLDEIIKSMENYISSEKIS